MRTKLTKITLAATLGFALTLTLSCSDGGGNNGEAPSTGEQSETKITKSKITGVSQKGPFVEGSTATLDELDDEFTQTGRSFRDIIADDKGSFEIRGVELISPYARLEAYGYYRNEVTGEVSKGPITLIAIADIREKDNVNVNLLTHLEYYRVLNLVEGGKSVAEAKKQAQKEILAVFGIDGNFENSEDMTIFGATEGDAALLAISVLLQGNLGEGEFSQRLTNFAQSLKESGKWENEAAKAAIADWASTANLAVIRSNITGWGLSSEVPDFEKYVTDYWTVAYSLGGCGSANSGEVKKDNRNAYRICKTGNWAVASELEYDTYQWVCLDANEGEIKAGDVSSRDYVCENKAWRTATSVEIDIQSVCLASTEGEIKAGKTTGTDYICKNKGWVTATEFERDTYRWVCLDANEGEIKAGKTTGTDYICKNKGWVTATEFERDIYQWVCPNANEGEIKAGNVSSRDYVCENKAWRTATSVETDIQSVCLASNEGEIKAGKTTDTDYICKNKGWVTATEFERDTYKWSCSDANEGEIKAGNVSGKDYICKNKGWVTATEFERDTYQWSCLNENEGEIKAGKTTGTDYICKNKGWETATEFERDTYRWSCSNANIGEIKAGIVSNKEYVCKYGIWREPSYKDKYCFENGCQYFLDSRDNQRYVYVTIGEQTWMGENLNYNTTDSKCYDNLDSNCDKYGRLYDWQTALTACPTDWHLPSYEEWDVMMNYIGGTVSTRGKNLKATDGWLDYIGLSNGTDDYGFSAVPGGFGYSVGNFENVGYGGNWWSASEYDSGDAYYWEMYYGNDDARWNASRKSRLFSVRCVQD